MAEQQEWPVGQHAEIDWTSDAGGEHRNVQAYWRPGRGWRLTSGGLIQTRLVTAVRPLRLVPADAIVVEKTSMISNLCHWQQGRGDARKQSHWDFHFGSPCPYRIVALILQGEPDPRDGMPPDPEVRYEYCDNGLHSIPAGWPCESCRLATARGDQPPVPRDEPLTLARVFRALADVHANAGSKSPVRMFTDAAEAAESASARGACVDCGFRPVTGQRCVDCGPDGAESAAERVAAQQPRRGVDCWCLGNQTCAHRRGAVGCAWPGGDSAASGAVSEAAQNDVTGTGTPAEAHRIEHEKYGTWPCGWQNRNQADCPIWRDLQRTPVPVEAVSDGSGHAERQDRAESAGALLARLGTVGAKWTAEFVATWHRLADEERGDNILNDPTPGGFLHGWFCNAIEAGRTAGASESRAEVARYWAAIEAASAQIAIVKAGMAHEYTRMTPGAILAVQGALDALAAALGDR